MTEAQRLHKSGRSDLGTISVVTSMPSPSITSDATSCSSAELWSAGGQVTGGADFECRMNATAVIHAIDQE